MKKAIRIRVSALLVDGNGKILLVNHHKGDRSYWLLPGGGLDFGENPVDCLRREMAEELGARVRAGDLLFAANTVSPDGERHILHLVFGGIWEQEPPAVFTSRDQRVTGAAWVSGPELRELEFHPDMKVEILEFLASGSRTRAFIPVRWLP